MRVTQLEEQLSNTLKAVDAFHAEMKIFKEYLHENSKVVNGILRKMDDDQEESNKRFAKMEERFRKSDLQFERMDKRFEKNDKRFEKNDKRFEKTDKRFEKMEERFEKMDKRFEKNDQRFEKNDQRLEKLDLHISNVLQEMAQDRKLREAQFELIMRKFESDK